MKIGLLLTVLSLWLATARADGFWDSLWHNTDQRGDLLMQRGDVAAAVQTYLDPRRKAYAELQAGDFGNAAKHFSAFNDSDGNYNRGNALARAGQLEEALKAYDAALAQNPNDKDARHNRELVAKALQQQPSQPNSSSENDASSKNSKNGDNNQSGQSGQSENKNSGKQSESKSNSGKQNSSGNNQTGKQRQDNSGQGEKGNNTEQKTAQGQQQSAQNKPADSNSQPGTPAPSNQARANDAEQAQRDAAAALGKMAAGKSSKSSDGKISEQQLAQDQWLRAIPDDPGGLLRRKFMIQHMIRQQGGQQ